MQVACGITVGLRRSSIERDGRSSSSALVRLSPPLRNARYARTVAQYQRALLNEAAHRAALIAVATASIMLGAGGSLAGQGISTLTAPRNLAFEVAAVKPNRSDNPPTSRFPLGIGDAFTPGGYFLATNQPLISYLRFAFKVANFERLPSWVSVERFDIEARASGMPSKDEMRVMMQALLEERFGLAVHNERRAARGLALILVKPGVLGPNLRPADSSRCDASGTSRDLIPCGRIGPSAASTPTRLHITGRSISLARLAAFVTNPATGIDRPVFDRTALSGLFDVDLDWTADPDAVSDGTKPDLADLTFGQALHDQLGLQMRAADGTVDVICVDRIQRPTSD